MNTLEMMNKAKENGATYKSVDLCYSDEKGFFSNVDGKPWSGGAFDKLNYLFDITEWKLVSELSNDEKCLLNNIPFDWRYIARDKNNSMHLFLSEPSKTMGYWSTPSGVYIDFPYHHLFKMVKWEDEKPVLILGLLEE